jgi:VWFA-related protein
MQARVVLLCVLLTAASAPASPRNKPGEGQQRDSQKTSQEKAGPDKEEVVRISVTLVQLDAVVTDKQGRLVTDLRSSDFEIYEDGRKQHITNFSFVSTQPEPLPAAATEPRSKAPLPPGPPTRLRPNQVRRTIALVVDDLGLSFESTAAVRGALKKFVDQQMQPGDLVAIIRTGAGMGALQQFTADKRELYASIERVRWNMVGRGGISAFAPIGGGVSVGGGIGESVDELRTEIYSVGTLGALNFVVRGLRELPGRKSVILLSDGFRLYNRDQTSLRVTDALHRLTDLANRASVVIYTIDARGLQTLAPTAADDFRGQTSEQIEQALDARKQELFDTQQGLQYLAQETGGFAVRNSNDLRGGIKRVLDDQRGYYLLGYVPESSTFRLERGLRKFHKVAVRIKTAGLNVRSRTGFYGIADEQARPAKRTPAQQVIGALMSPFTSGDVHLKLTSLFSHDPKAGSIVRSLLHIDPQDLSFKVKPDGSHEAVIDMLAVTFTDNGRIVQQEGRTYTLNVADRQFAEWTQQGFLYAINVPIKKAGAYQLRVAVRDSASERVGSANQFIEVPDIGKNRLTLSGLVISGSDPAKRRTAEQATRDAARDKEGAVEDADPQAGPAIRMIRRGMDLDYGFLIYNAQREPNSNQVQLEYQVLVLKDGKRIFAGKVAPLNKTGELTDLRHIPATGRLRFGTDLEPGDYVLQVTVTDKLAKEKYRSATQWMDFEIVK